MTDLAAHSVILRELANGPWIWTPLHQKEFDTIKSMILKEILLEFPQRIRKNMSLNSPVKLLPSEKHLSPLEMVLVVWSKQIIKVCNGSKTTKILVKTLGIAIVCHDNPTPL
eukprot:TRINITY_DN4381_c0_g1_i1.p2 TRINITY_DN4381_c0_g1~~TRINITY_DN4381_c0_g1_i1.p2  ORF type:complete len:112 (-),score=5.34 TRINITY_DN4381_c0_g1_i1:1053-1388(-)